MIRAYLGILALLVAAWLISENRRAIPWRTVAGGIALQGVGAAILIGLPSPIGLCLC